MFDVRPVLLPLFDSSVHAGWLNFRSRTSSSLTILHSGHSRLIGSREPSTTIRWERGPVLPRRTVVSGQRRRLAIGIMGLG